MNAPEYDALNRKLNSEAMTLLRNSQNLIPITHLNKGRIAVVSMGNDTESVFQKTITLYADNVGRFDDSNPLPSLLDTLKHLTIKSYWLYIAAMPNIEPESAVYAKPGKQ